MGSDWQSKEKRSWQERPSPAKDRPERKRGEAWQEASRGNERQVDRPRRREGMWAVYAAVAASLLGLLLYFLLQSPPKTPVILAIGTDYAAPVSPNAWAIEDRDALFLLGNILTIEEVSGRWDDSQPAESEAFKMFRGMLEGHKRTRRGFRTVSEPLIVYFSMPGVVNEQQDPCLLPPGASTWDSSDWITIKSIVETIDEVIPGERNKILVLDSHQFIADWQLGIVYNTFGERLKEYMDSCNVENLAVITSASEGQQSWSSPGLGGTAFGKILQLGLAGGANRGDDRAVSLQELKTYLQSEVNRWARNHRDADQLPAVYLSKTGMDFMVAHSMSGDQLGSFQSPNKGATTTASIPSDEIEELWSQLGKIGESDFRRLDPLALSHLEHELLDLEQHALGGNAYAKKAAQLHGQLDKKFELIQKNFNSADRTIADWRLDNRGQVGNMKFEVMHSLPLCTFFGDSDAKYGEKVTDLLKGVAAKSSDNTEQAKLDPALVELALALESTQFLVAANQRELLAEGNRAAAVGQVLELRRRSEQLAVPMDVRRTPTDERAHMAMRMLLNTADASLRGVEDGLFVGYTPTPNTWDDIRRAHDAAQRIGDQLARVYRVRDTASAELPYLAMWYNRVAASDGIDELRQQMASMIRIADENHDLGKALAQLDQIDEADIEAEVSRLAGTNVSGNVEAQLTTRLSEFRGRCKELAEGGKNASGTEIRTRIDALTSPLATGTITVSGKQQAIRSTLMDKWLEFDAELNKQFFATAVVTGPAESQVSPSDVSINATATKAVEFADVVDKVVAQLVLVLLDLESSNSTNDDSLTQLDRLESVNSGVRERLRIIAENVQESHDNRLQLATAEHTARCAASIAGGIPPEDDVISQLRRFDLQSLLLWHADRAMSGFWATTSSRDATTFDQLLAIPRFREPDFFATAASDYLQCVSDIGKRSISMAKEIQLQLDLRSQRLSQLKSAAKYGVAFRGDTTPIADARSDVNVRLYFDRDALPTGRASINLSTDASTPLKTVVWQGSENAFVDVPVTSDDARLIGRAKGVNARTLQAIAFFRGHEYKKELDVNSLRGTLVRYSPPRYDGQTITLLGDAPSPPSVVFVLDCSGSMGATIETEGGDTTRMEAAKNALGTMINELAARNRVPRPRVGVYFFGHRLSWNDKLPFSVENNLEINSRAVDGRIPPGLMPAVDVERVQPLAEFGGQAIGEVRRRLARVSHFGLTPVNLAIIRAMGEFGDDDQRYSKSIIVITDGKNDQRHPNWAPGFSDSQVTSTNAVIDAWSRINVPLPERKRIPIYIVGFGIPEDEKQVAERDFKRIADHTTKDGWLSTNDSGELIAFLRKRLEFNGYVVREVDGGARTPITTNEYGEEAPIALGQTQPVNKVTADLPVDVEVDYQGESATVMFEGGEALELQVPSGGIQIEAVPFDEPAVAQDELLGPSGRSTMLMRVHRPKRLATGAQFRVSIENTDQRVYFTPRPAEVWLEVTPQGASQPYVFYDRVFEAETAMPVVGFEAADWPAGGDSAQVKFWCADQETPAELTIAASDILSRDGTLSRKVPSRPGVELVFELSRNEAGEDVLVVTEQHDGASKPTNSLRVSVKVDHPTIAPESVAHRFDDENGIARHEYRFRSGLSPNELAALLSVRIATAEAVKRNGYRISDDRGLPVPVPTGSGTIPTSASLGR